MNLFNNISHKHNTTSRHNHYSKKNVWSLQM